MRARYRLHACPEGDCPKIGRKGAKCPDHSQEMVEVVVRREDDGDRAKQAADRASKAARKVDQVAGDPFGFAHILRGMSK